MEGNIAVSTVACSSLLEVDLMEQRNQLAIRDCGGLKPLCKFILASDERLRLNVIKIFNAITTSPFIQLSFFDENLIKPFVVSLNDSSPVIQELTFDTAAKLALYFRNRTAMRENGFVSIAVKTLDKSENTNVLKAVSHFLWVLLRSKNCRKEANKINIIEIVVRRLRQLINKPIPK